jgi:hypothetical protein
MSYQDIVDGLHERFQLIDALVVILDYEPTAAQDGPLLYSLLDGFTRVYDDIGESVEVTYRTLHRLCIMWQDNEEAEKTLIALANAIPIAVDGDPRLGLLLKGDGVRIVQGEAGWVNIGGTEYRSLDFYSECTEFNATGSI